MKRIMEKVSILALSFILTTSFSISSAQSAMFAYYKGIPHSMIELLVSLPSAGSWFHSSSINGLGAYFQSVR